MTQRDWKPGRRVEEQYAQDILSILMRYFSSSEAESVRLLTAREFFQKYAWQAAQRMITGLFYENARTWRQAARHSMRGREIYQSLQRELKGKVGIQVRSLVHSNAQLISSLPTQLAEQASKKAMQTQFAGERFENIVSNKIFEGLNISRARLIARTEVSKASTALTRVRAENLNLDWYVWETSRDGNRVRFSHRKMQGILVSFSEPPSPEQLVGEKSVGHYAAGDIWNCRCYPAPLLRFDQVSWPHRTHYGGRIQNMSLAEFRSINRFDAAAAA